MHYLSTCWHALVLWIGNALVKIPMKNGPHRYFYCNRTEQRRPNVHLKQDSNWTWDQCWIGKITLWSRIKMIWCLQHMIAPQQQGRIDPTQHQWKGSSRWMKKKEFISWQNWDAFGLQSREVWVGNWGELHCWNKDLLEDQVSCSGSHLWEILFSSKKKTTVTKLNAEVTTVGKETLIGSPIVPMWPFQWQSFL